MKTVLSSLGTAEAFYLWEAGDANHIKLNKCRVSAPTTETQPIYVCKEVVSPLTAEFQAHLAPSWEFPQQTGTLPETR